MKSILLAAGEGTRLRPYTLEVPKCLVEVEGRSLIDRQLDILTSEGISEQIIIGGYLVNKLYGRGSKILENKRFDETNMVWTLFCADEELEGDIIVSYGDIVYSSQNLQSLLNSTADIAVTIDMDWEDYWSKRMEDPLSDAETLKISSDGFITEIGQKPRSLSEIEGQYMGLMKFSAEGVKTLKKVFYQAQKDGNIRGKNPENAYMTDLLQLMIDKGHKIKAVPVHGGWIEVDTVDDLKSRVTQSRIKNIT
ncbi:MAG: phosphocholine cytidylyltransferase family protein [Cyclobacteriaceae bacterium]|nr:phosphocholine cytidylyltransferase family protein [Cyclobacteriaceae bacterium]